MNKNVVLDASAVLALLNQEPGYKQVEDYLPEAIMSSVNASEVMAVLTHQGIPNEDAETIATQIIKEIVPFDLEHAVLTAALRTSTKQYGLSLGDRACLALAKSRHSTVLTADKIWGKLTIPGIKIHIIR
jgi:PIN domain nuclease of toxin-antitoxin system